MADKLERPYFPIVYVRGYAATMDEIEDTVATPYMGFNLGSTKIREDFKGEIQRFIFESPLIRLMKEHGYVDAYKHGQLASMDEQVTPRSIWVFRYYEKRNAPGQGVRKSISEFAIELREFILRIRDQVCLDDAQARERFRVYLVGHSMGGLICRCYLQNICRYGVVDGKGKSDSARNEELELSVSPGRTSQGYVPASVHLVDKVFTYGTPHGGIEFLGQNVPDLGFIDRFDVKNFNRGEMRRYLGLNKPEHRNEPIESLAGAFNPKRFFCFVGTNYKDYEAFAGISRSVTGPKGDGLVLTENAVVTGAPCAYAYRSHSGDYGIVNSYEGYQNLRRFLFGYWEVEGLLYADRITLPERIAKIKNDPNNPRPVRATYNVETTLSLRGELAHLDERQVSQHSAIRADYDTWVNEKQPIRLFRTYLMEDAKTEGSKKKVSEGGDTALAFCLNLGIERPIYEVERRFWELWKDDHFEGASFWQETITFHVHPNVSKQVVRYGLGSDAGPGSVNKNPDIEQGGKGCYRIVVPLGFKPDISNPPRPGYAGQLVLEARRRHDL